MTRQLVFYSGSLTHFADRLAPLWRALPEPYRGPYFARGRALQRSIDLGVEVRHGVPKQSDRELCIVCSHEDYRSVRPAQTIMVAHGVGQTYNGAPGKGLNHPSYSGGDKRERVVLNICAGEYDAQKCRDAGQKAVAVGPFHLDRHYLLPPKPRSNPPVVCFSAHTDAHVVPETRWAWPHFQDEIVRLIREHPEYRYVGHCHPRMWSWFRTFWPRLKVPFLLSFDEVLEQADLYVTDNSSTLMEFASTGRPVLVLNAPWYRRDVRHGLRFWDAIPGMQVDEPEGLLEGIKLALDDSPELQAARRYAVQYVYSDADGNLINDGHGTKVAVRAIMDLMNAI